MLFSNLFCNEPEMVNVRAGRALFREGDPGHVMYVLVTGEASIQLGDMVLDNIGPGAIVGEMAVIDGSPRSTTVIAKSDCMFTVIDKKRFHFLVDGTPSFAIEVMKVMALRLRQCDQKLLNGGRAQAG